MVQAWWQPSPEGVIPTPEMMPPDSTFICLYEGMPALSVTMYLTNTPEFCMVDNFIGNPEMRGPLRRELTKELLAYVEYIAQGLGYKKIFCMASNERLASYYGELGFNKTLSGVTTFTKDVQG